MAFEIADLRGLGPDLSGEMVVYIEAGSNPMTEEAWATYTPDPGWILNTPRAPQFDVLNVLSSPYVATGEFTYYTDQSGFTWQAVAAVQNRVYPFDPDDYASFDPPLTTSAQAGYALATPLPGTIQYNSNDKNHENIYYADDENGNPKLQYYVTDPWGNVYILKSVNAANDTPEKVAAAVDAAVLPDGWVKSTGYLDQDTSYFPVYSGDIAHANEFRDSADSAWMQIGWASSGITLAAMVGDGMPIWGSAEDGTVQGTSTDDEVHGGGGDDLISGLGGSDEIWGDIGADVIDPGSGADIVHGTITDLNGDSISSFGIDDTLDIEGTLVERAALDVAGGVSTVTLTVDGSSIQLSGDFSAGDFMTVARGAGTDAHTLVTFVPFLPSMSEGVSVAPTSINGIANEPYLTGDGATGFTLELKSAVSAFHNALGVYTVGADGTISDVRILFDDTLNVSERSVDLGTPGESEKLGFFLIQNGFNTYGRLPDDLSFVAEGTGGAADIDTGAPPVLHSTTLGDLTGAVVFHSIATLNPADAAQVLSGVAEGGEELLIGFEDLPGDTGDNDFQDVIVGIRVDGDSVLG